MNAIITCVDFSDLLAVTLPYNRHHFARVVVVTTTTDYQTHEVAVSNHATPFATDAFYDNGAMFAKYRALEQGLDFLGREGWLAIMDVDVLWPKNAHHDYQHGCLYTPKRRMLKDLSELAAGVPAEEKWTQYPYYHYLLEWSGYTQIFHTSDPALGPPPWHETDWIHAGGGDSFFQMKWPADKKLRPSWDCLHLGDAGTNWTGRVTARLDGTVPVGAGNRLLELRQLLRGRAGKSGPDRFKHERFQK